MLAVKLMASFVIIGIPLLLATICIGKGSENEKVQYWCLTLTAVLTLFLAVATIALLLCVVWLA